MYGKKKMEGACYLLDAAEGRSNRSSCSRDEARGKRATGGTTHSDGLAVISAATL